MVSKIRFLAAALIMCAAGGGCATGTPGTTGGSSSTSSGTGGGTGGSGGDDAGPPAPVCGNGTTEQGEDCDDGNTTDGDGCKSDCKVEPGYGCTGQPSVCSPACGDGVFSSGEECDDGNSTSDDGCSVDCKVEDGWSCKGVPSTCTTECGDGVIVGDEVCDDGNKKAEDGCNAGCKLEDGWACKGAPSACSTVCGDGIKAGQEQCDDSNGNSNDGCSATCEFEKGYNCSPGTPTVCTPVCGDGVVAQGKEQCDDGNNVGSDGCDPSCQPEVGWQCSGVPSQCKPICGDKWVRGSEECDDGNLIPGDGCNGQCKAEYGHTCSGEPSVCPVKCGDGVIVSSSGEICDDGNANSGDGCSAQCKVEAGWYCTGTTSMCKSICGDGKIVGSETCDDNNANPSDGCSPTCTLEPGWTCTGTPSTCISVCGNGVQGGYEQCDDGNTLSGDGCSSNCTVEGGFTCTGTAPTVCAGMCGDSVVVKGEQCDDGNTINGDCCSSGCLAEAGCEIESNDNAAHANDPTTIGANGKVKGFILPASDVDTYQVVIPSSAPSGQLIVATLDGPMPGDTCASKKVDTLVTVYNAGNQIVAQNDDISSSNLCSSLTLPALPPGTYHVAVKNSPAATTASKTYSYSVQFTLTLAVCGNGVQEAGEQCDDGNSSSGDGCGASCKLEGLPAEVEPNDTFAHADQRALDAQPVLFSDNALLAGGISVPGDKDLYKVSLAQDRVVRFETFDNINPGDCQVANTRIRVFSTAGTQLYTDATSGIGPCSAAVLALSAGDYYVQVESASVGSTVPAYFIEMSLTTDDGAEVEPNATQAQADAMSGTEMFVTGGHQTNSDVDYYAVTVPAGKSLRAEIIEGSTSKTCESLGIDSRLTLYNANALQLEDDDDNGRGFCSLIDGTGYTPVNPKAHALAAGTYYLQVRASSIASSSAAGQFDYRLVVTLR